MNTNDSRFDNSQNEPIPTENSIPVNESTPSTEMQGGHEHTDARTSPTYGQVYSPGGASYSSNPSGQGNNYSSSPYSGAYTPYQNFNNPNFTGNGVPPMQPNKPKKSNGAAIAIICCCIVAAMVVVGCVSVALFGRVLRNNPAAGELDQNTGLAPESKDPQDSTPSGEASMENEDPSVSKNPGVSPDVSGGKIGELMTTAEAVALIKDSVVEISTEHKATSFFGQYVTGGAGSGVIVAKEGYIITNNHVVEGASAVKITLTNGNKYDARLIGTDSATDIAVLKIDPTENLTVAVLGSSESLVLAQDVIVIGNPLGSLGGTITSGIISALDRKITVEGEQMTLLQTNAAVNPGNSGGGMFNLRGELVGIVNAKSIGEDIEGLGFAIPIDTAYTVFNQLVDYGYVRGRIDHGLNLIDIDDLFTASAYRVNALGVYVLESKYSDEFKNGDRIVSVNGTEVLSSSEVNAALSDFNVGDKVKFVVVRRGKTVEINHTLREYTPADSNDVSFD